MKTNRMLVNERNAMVARLETASHKLREKEDIIAVLVCQMGGNAFVGKRQATHLKGTLVITENKNGTRLVFKRPIKLVVAKNYNGGEQEKE